MPDELTVTREGDTLVTRSFDVKQMEKRIIAL